MSDAKPTLKTYSKQLPESRRMPTEYELVSTRLVYDYPRNFELGVGNPVAEWTYAHREDSTLQVQDWEVFADPRRTTYRGYNTLQNSKETVVDGLLREIDDSGYDTTLSDEWVSFLHNWYAPLRYPGHGIEMLSAYVGHLSPASRIKNVGTFQAADEMRRVQRIAYRSVQLNANRGGCDPAEHQGFWENAEAFQPLRELIERALIAYDYGEALAVLHLVVQPHVDPLINEQLAGACATANGDRLLAAIHFSLNEDALWHRALAADLIKMIVADTPENKDILRGHYDNWKGHGAAAVDALAAVLPGVDGAAAATAIKDAADARVNELLA